MTDSTMPRTNPTSNVAAAERGLGQELRKLVRTYDRLVDKHVALIEEIHQVVLEIGRRLRSGRAMHRSNKEFSEWCARYGLDQGAFRDQQERTAAMLISELHDDGVAPLGLEENPDGSPVPEGERVKLDLTGCRRTGPTNIMAWARKHQPELFPNLAKKREEARRAKGLQTKNSGEKSWPQDDDISHVGLAPAIAHEVNRGGVPEVADVLAENRRLADEVGRLTKENAALSAEVETLRRRLTERPAKPEPQRVAVLKAEIAALKAEIAALSSQRLPA